MGLSKLELWHFLHNNNREGVFVRAIVWGVQLSRNVSHDVPKQTHQPLVVLVRMARSLRDSSHVWFAF